MIIHFLGKRISTETIYEISDLVEIFHSSRHRNGCYDLEHEKPFMFVFSIKFFSGETQQVLKNADYEPEKLFTPEDKVYIEENFGRAPKIALRMADEFRLTERYKEQRAEVEKVMNELIGYWSNNQGDIPKIDFLTK